MKPSRNHLEKRKDPHQKLGTKEALPSKSSKEKTLEAMQIIEMTIAGQEQTTLRSFLSQNLKRRRKARCN
jgi:hypothetical protein